MADARYTNEVYPTARRACDCGEHEWCPSTCAKFTADRERQARMLDASAQIITPRHNP